MILGIGTDLCNIERIQGTLDRFGDRFRRRVFTEVEQKKAERRADVAGTYAKRWAAKEACSKALGTGLRMGIAWKDMAVSNLHTGQPVMEVTGWAAERLAQMTPPGHEALIHVTLTDDHPWAQAIVVIEARPLGAPALTPPSRTACSRNTHWAGAGMARADQGGGLMETIKTVVYALLIAGAFRTLFFQPFWIPSGSMKDTLLIGDFLFVNKMAYGYSQHSCPFSACSFINGRWMASEPERGDVVVFRHPVNGSDFIKRVIGLPGDRVQIQDGVPVH